MKRVFSLALAAVMAVSAFTVAGGSVLAADRVTYKGNEYYTSVEDAGEELREEMVKSNGDIAIYYAEDMTENWSTEYYENRAVELLHEIHDAAEEHTGNPVEGDYLHWRQENFLMGYGGQYSTTKVYYTFTYNETYYTTASEEEELAAAVDEVYSQLGLASLSDYDAVYEIYKYVCANVSYDMSASPSDYSFSAYGALMKGKAVCQGISSLIYRLCNMCGIDCRIVANSEHGWNIVKLGSGYYVLDATNDLGKVPEDARFFLKGADSESDGIHVPGDEYKTAEFTSKYKLAETDYGSSTSGSGSSSSGSTSGSTSGSASESTGSTSGSTSTTCKTHTWNSGKTTTAATCAKAGVKTYTCTVCGATKTESIAKKSHSWKVATKGSATNKKSGKFECTVCGATKKLYYPKTIKLSTTSYTYNGKAKKPTVTIKDSNGSKISSKYYTVKYVSQSTGKTVSSMKNPGKYYVKVTFKTRYSGSLKKTVTIKPKKTSIKSIKASKKGFTVKWGKVSTQNTGYQVQYSTSKSFKNAKTATIKKTGTTSKKVTKLKAKKKYYVRVRTYKTVKVNGKSTKLYSAWSSAKGVTTKK